MIYINEGHLKNIGVNWTETINTIDTVVKENKFTQPLKPYLDLEDPTARIIAMPANVMGSIQQAGIKWIASFPNNLGKGLPRAHSTVILNNNKTGVPEAIINTPLLSIIRTASVTGWMFKKWLEANQPEKKLTVGIIGMGPIGQYHAEMIHKEFGEYVSKIIVTDKRATNLPDYVTLAGDASQIYNDVDVLITATAGTDRYIDKPFKKGTLVLNISLRDLIIKEDVFNSIDEWVVDAWYEINRKNTDVEQFNKVFGISNPIEIFENGFYEWLQTRQGKTICFNPMGMSCFDIALGNYYKNAAIFSKMFTDLAD